MKDQLEQIRADAETAIQEATSLQLLDEVRVKFLGRKGKITEVLRGLGQLTPEERPKIGQMANEVKSALAELIEGRKQALSEAEGEQRAQRDRADLS